MDWYSMISGSAVGGLLNATVFVGLLWIALVHPHRIQSILEFRLATVLLGGSVLATHVVQSLQWNNFLAYSPGPGFRENPGLPFFITIIPPALSMLAAMVTVDSVTPRSKTKDAM